VYAQEPPDAQEMLVFVGKLISIEERPDPCKSEENAETMCISMDALWSARYEVISVLHGVPSTPEIAFDVADHYGFPSFAHNQHALLFVNLRPDGNYLEKYQGFEVHETVSGEWATCGNPIDERLGGEPRGLRRIAFRHDLGNATELSAAGIERQFPPDLYRIEAGRAYCTQGVGVHDLYEQVRTGVLAARGIALSPLD
jgi:hypothetical protein